MYHIVHKNPAQFNLDNPVEKSDNLTDVICGVIMLGSIVNWVRY